MKESSLYLKYFKTYMVLYIFLILLGVLSVFILTKKQSDLYKTTVVFTAKANSEEILTPDDTQNRQLLIDNKVALLRTENYQSNLGLKKNESLNVYRFAPFALKIEYIHSEPSPNQLKLNKFVGDVKMSLNNESGLKDNFLIVKVGSPITYKVQNKNWVNFLLGIFLSTLTALVLSLLMEYFKNY